MITEQIPKKPANPKVGLILFYILSLTILFVMSTATPLPSLAIDLLTTLLIPLALGISGWVAFFYQYYSDKPKIKGKILQVMYGKMPNPIT